MKKIIILTIATLSTGIVLSSTLKKSEAVAKPVAPVTIHEIATSPNKAATTSYDAVGNAD